MTDSIDFFLDSWVVDYQTKASGLPLFSSHSTGWDLAKGQALVRKFYHARGHFYEFLWFLGSLTPDQRAKQVILDNIREEFGPRTSHEQLYVSFACELGVDLQEEILLQSNYTTYLQRFNQGHLEYVLKQPWPKVWAAFAAYEKLDNLDYTMLLELVLKIKPDLSPKAQGFFRIHMGVHHFESTEPLLREMWPECEPEIRESFEFIKGHQLEMYSELGRDVLN